MCSLQTFHFVVECLFPWGLGVWLRTVGLGLEWHKLVGKIELFVLDLEQKIPTPRGKEENQTTIHFINSRSANRKDNLWSINIKCRRSRDENQSWQWRIFEFRTLSRKKQSSYCLGAGKFQKCCQLHWLFNLPL